jgi:arginase
MIPEIWTPRLDVTVYRGPAGDRNDFAATASLKLGERLARILDLRTTLIGELRPALNAKWRPELENAQSDLRALANHVDLLLQDKQNLLLITRRCSASLATLPVIMRHFPNCVLVWFDAHADLNTPAASAYGFLGGMVVSGAAGLWDTGFGAGLPLSQIVLVGSRDHDQFEQDLIESAGVVHIPIGATSSMCRHLTEAIAGRRVYIHFDCDVLQPGLLPTDFEVDGGIDFETLQEISATLARENIIGLEIAELQMDARSASNFSTRIAQFSSALEPILKRLQPSKTNLE